MSEISNKTLAFLLVGAIAISLMGTLFSLNRLGKIGAPMVSGQATINTGSASMTIASSLSIRLAVSTLDFGNCRPGSAPGSWFESNNTAIDGTAAGQCDNLQTVGNITIENDGSAIANVSINISSTDLTGGTADNRSVWFSTWATASDPGACITGINHNWQNMTAVFWENKTCSQLNFSDTNDTFMIFFGVWAPSDSVAASRTATVTFVARGY
jgi:hypothetical protein